MIDNGVIEHKLRTLHDRLLITKSVVYDGSIQWNITDVARWLRDMNGNILPVQWEYILPIANQLWEQTEWKLK